MENLSHKSETNIKVDKKLTSTELRYIESIVLGKEKEKILAKSRQELSKLKNDIITELNNRLARPSEDISTKYIRNLKHRTEKYFANIDGSVNKNSKTKNSEKVKVKTQTKEKAENNKDMKTQVTNAVENQKPENQKPENQKPENQKKVEKQTTTANKTATETSYATTTRPGEIDFVKLTKEREQGKNQANNTIPEAKTETIVQKTETPPVRTAPIYNTTEASSQANSLGDRVDEIKNKKQNTDTLNNTNFQENTSKGGIGMHYRSFLREQEMRRKQQEIIQAKKIKQKEKSQELTPPGRHASYFDHRDYQEKLLTQQNEELKNMTWGDINKKAEAMAKAENKYWFSNIGREMEIKRQLEQQQRDARWKTNFDIQREARDNTRKMQQQKNNTTPTKYTSKWR